ncbi:unnamed protein product [Blepharisma stoltei]|uniref:Serine carboxypeptidase n=1 Tax=Blepharisma stoltei TaxID=1481888 RepID=A0AAU9K0T0_9CILI|nr:unnamed protein product [Blepharisma stoltei]
MKILLLIFIQGCLSSANLSDTDASWSILGFTGYAGEIVINNLTGSSLFYWLFQSANGNIFTDKLPIILWLQGGPGCSGESGMLNEKVGPFLINSNTQPIINPDTWISSFHVISVDYPLGAGFSFANAAYDMKNTTIQASAYLYNFLVKLSKKYPTWFNRDLYIFGDSYAGHWIPGIAYTILMNNRSPSPQAAFQLKGIGIGDPWIEAYTQDQYYSDYAYQSGLIDQEELKIIQTLENELVAQLTSENYDQASTLHDNILGNIVNYAGNVNVMNLRCYNNCYDLGKIPEWMNLASTKNMLHAPMDIVWQDCNGALGNAWTEDTMTSMASYFPLILDNVKVLIYNGQDDLLVNSMGTQALLAKLNWPYIQEFFNAYKIIWKVNGEVAGYVTNYNNLSFVLVLKAGHLMSHDQPHIAKDMVYRFINNEGWQ